MRKMTNRRRTSAIFEGGVDDPPAKEEKKEEKKPIELKDDCPEKLIEYFSFSNHEKLFKIISQKWGTFCLLCAPIYIYHLLWTIAGINAYADYTRENVCGNAQTKEAASAVFDTAIAMVSMWHMIEWIRWTFLLTAALVEANLIPIFNVLQLNIIYGVIACFVAIGARFSADGGACAQTGVQAERAFYCGLQVISLVLSVPFCMAHGVLMKINGKQWCDE
jgi:hypothetical protein